MRARWIHTLRPLLAVAALLGLGLAAQAQTAATPPAAAAPTTTATTTAPEPKPDDTNAERAISQPGNNAPFWRAVRNSGNQAGITNLKGEERGTLIQSFVQYPGSSYTTAGEAWRQVRNRWILPYGGSLMLIAVLALVIFYWRRGAMGVRSNDGQPIIERFTPFERAAHWTNAVAFVAMALSGIVLAFGKFFLLPVMGATLFGWLSFVLKNLHNFVGPLFAVSLIVVVITFIKDNFPTAVDFLWLRKGGGMVGDEHEVPSHRFNAGEKGIFWLGMCISGLVIVGTGLWLDQIVPALPAARGDMQIAHMIHSGAAMLMMTLLIGHIYMGTIGVKGAYKAMRTGWVDEAWAREHHELWYKDIKDGKIPARRSSAAPAETPPAQARPT
jgi:formate dehydrogenase subunit gamma